VSSVFVGDHLVQIEIQGEVEYCINNKHNNRVSDSEVIIDCVEVEASKDD
jgi:hypothetical protein